jgi:23S rRNA (cytosine1962-C5)-methyltransferase
MQSMFDIFTRAAAARNPIRAEGTDALRLADARGDGCGDVEIDDLAGHWLVQTRDAFPAWLPPEEVCKPAGAIHAKSIHWKKLGEKEAPRWIAGEKLEAPFTVRETGLQYWIDFGAGYSQGLFLDQRLNRARVREFRGSVLNCFAYTCAFGVCAASGNAHTVNVDLSKKYLDWGKRNYSLNGIDPSAHEFLHGEMFDWLKRFKKKGRAFDLVILDPPTFSRNAAGEVFSIESRMSDLVACAESVLSASGTIFCSTNQRSLGGAQFLKIILRGLSDAPAWSATPAPMPPDFTGEKYLKTWWLKRK